MMRATSTLLTLTLCAASAAGQSTLIRTLTGDEIGDLFGTEVAGAGDVNNDGVPDVIVGAERDDNSFTNAGSVTVYSGADGSVLNQWDGPGTSAYFGHAVEAAGDVNNDGYDDVIAGGTFQPVIHGKGFAVVYSGFDGSVLHHWQANTGADQLGETVAGLGDINGDDHSDLIVGAWVESNPLSQNGSAYVYSGIDGSLLYEYHGAANNDFLGEEVGGGDDVDGDGVHDFIVAGRSAGIGGEVHVYSGATGDLIWSFISPTWSANLGSAVDLIGDVNGDGKSEILVSDRIDDSSAGHYGRVHIYSGADASLLYTVGGTAQQDGFGYCAAGVGDCTGDGVPDFVAGNYGDDDNGSASGSVEVFSGADGSRQMTLFGNGFGWLQGWSIDGVGDIDGDGLGDFITGMPADYNVSDTGKARVYSGKCHGSAIPYGIGTAGSGGFVPQLSAESCPGLTSRFKLRITDVVGGAFGLMLLGVAPANLQGLSGTILVAPPFLLTLPTPTGGFGPGNGSWQVQTILSDNPAQVGATVYLQSVFLDSGVVGGTSMTNGLQLTIR